MLQQKEFINALFNEWSNFNGDEEVMPHEMKFVLDEDKEEVACLNNQRKVVGWTFRTVVKTENQNFILVKDEIEAVMSQAKGKSFIEVEKTKLTIRTSQEAEGQKWSVVNGRELC